MSRISRLKWTLLGSSAILVLALDLLTKRFAQDALAMGERVAVLPFLTLERTRNTGAAFGILSGHDRLIIVAVVMATLVVFAYVALEDRVVLAGLAGGLVVGGSMGNLVERVTIGHVTDFIRLPHWPIFNFADMFVVIGVSLMIAGLMMSVWHGEEGRQAEGDYGD